MSLFDELTCVHELPFPDERGEYADYNFSSVIWQTKSLERCMGVYRITEKGKLQFKEMSAWYNDRPGQDVVWKDHKHYGMLKFYESLQGDKQDLWVEFECKVDGGQTKEFKLISFDLCDNAKRLRVDAALVAVYKKQLERHKRLWYKTYKYLWAIPVCKTLRFMRVVLSWTSDTSRKVEKFLTPF